MTADSDGKRRGMRWLVSDAGLPVVVLIVLVGVGLGLIATESWRVHRAAQQHEALSLASVASVVWHNRATGQTLPVPETRLADTLGALTDLESQHFGEPQYYCSLRLRNGRNRLVGRYFAIFDLREQRVYLKPALGVSPHSYGRALPTVETGWVAGDERLFRSVARSFRDAEADFPLFHSTCRRSR